MSLPRISTPSYCRQCSNRLNPRGNEPHRGFVVVRWQGWTMRPPYVEALRREHMHAECGPKFVRQHINLRAEVEQHG